MASGHCHKERMENAEEVLKRELDTSTLQSFGDQKSGCINDGLAYRTDHGPVFVKFNSNPQGEEMFEGEYQGLLALADTGKVQVPNPLKIIGMSNGSALLVLDYVEMSPLSDFVALGEQVARLHQHNADMLKRARKLEQTVTSGQKVKQIPPVCQFGFQVPTYAGYSRQTNQWNNDWVDFFARKMEDYVNLIEIKHNEREARPLWNTLVPKLPSLFTNITVEPALLHGDLWRGNIAETLSGPVSFDPISLYGHSEFDLSIMYKHGGFQKSFFDSYHSYIPKAPGFDDRYDFYSLHHHFQIWSHFGDDFVEDALGIVEPEHFRANFGQGFKKSTLDILRRLIKKCS